MSSKFDTDKDYLATQVVADIPRFHAERRPDARALVFGARETSYAELDEHASAIANGLLTAGLEPGARVAMLTEDSDESYELLFGIAKARCVMTGVNWRLAPPEVRYILEDGEVEALFVDPKRLEMVERLLPALPSIRLVVVFSEEEPADAGGRPRFATWRDAQARADPNLPGYKEEVFAQLYTSGTTGRSKGVRLANRSFFAVLDSMRAVGDPWIGWTAADVTLLNIPAFHIAGLWWVMTAFSAGAAGVVMATFQPAEIHALVPRFGVTKICLVPAMIQMVLAEPGCEEVDWSTLGHIVYGGAPIPKIQLERSLAVFECGMAQIYGLTETGNTAICLRPEDHLEDGLLLAAGRPYPGVKVKVIDEEGRELPTGEIGEVCLWSPANMVGYWRLPEATAATLKDGWVHTGDAGQLDERGYLFIRDRIKDMIISGGENIYPAEIESVLAACPGVLEAAVIGIPDERWGEQVVALVVRTADELGASLRKRALLAHCRSQLADFKVPSTIEFTTELPRTPSGKIQKAILRRPYWEGRERQV